MKWENVVVSKKPSSPESIQVLGSVLSQCDQCGGEIGLDKESQQRVAAGYEKVCFHCFLRYTAESGEIPKIENPAPTEKQNADWRAIWAALN